MAAILAARATPLLVRSPETTSAGSKSPGPIAPVTRAMTITRKGPPPAAAVVTPGRANSRQHRSWPKTDSTSAPRSIGSSRSNRPRGGNCGATIPSSSSISNGVKGSFRGEWRIGLDYRLSIADYASQLHQQSCTSRIFFGTVDARLLALDAATGQPCGDFGEHGTVRLDVGVGRVQEGQYGVTSPPAVIGDVVVVGSSIGDNRRVDMEHGTVRGFDVRTGRELWSFDPDSPQRRGSGISELVEGSGRDNRCWQRLGTDFRRHGNGSGLRPYRLGRARLLRRRATGR